METHKNKYYEFCRIACVLAALTAPAGFAQAGPILQTTEKEANKALGVLKAPDEKAKNPLLPPAKPGANKKNPLLNAPFPALKPSETTGLKKDELLPWTKDEAPASLIELLAPSTNQTPAPKKTP